MRKLLPLTVALSSFFWYPGAAGEFANLAPETSFLYTEFLDIPALKATYSETPVGKAFAELDWKTAIVQLAQSDDLPGTKEISEDELRSVLNRIEEAYTTVTGHMNGSWAMVMGDMKHPINVFAEHEGLRAEFVIEDLGDAMTGEEDPELLAHLEKERERDLIELAALLGEFSFYAEIENEDSLTNTLNTWARELAPTFNEMEQVSYASRKVDGVDLHGISYTHSDNVPAIGLQWFIHDGVWVTTFTSSALEQRLAELKTPPANSLGATAYFKEQFPAAGTADTFTYINMPLLDTWIRQAVEEMGDLPEAGGLNANRILTWLGLDALAPITQTTTMGKEVNTSFFKMGFTRETGLSRLILAETAPVQIPSMIHTEMRQVTATHWSIGDFWTRLEQELMTLAPEAAAGLGMVRMLATGQLGFDIKLQFFDHLEDGVIFCQSMDPEVMAELTKAMESDDPNAILEANAQHPTGGQNYLIGLQTKNEDAIREAMTRLMRRFYPQGAPDPEMFDGIAVQNPIPPGTAGGMMDSLVQFAFVDGWLLLSIGERTLLEQAIAASKDPALQLRNDPGFQKTRAMLPADAYQLQYTSGQQQEEAMKMATSSVQMIAPDGFEVPDISFLANLYEHMMQVTTRNGLMIEIESVMQYKD